jgi:hypothetical protein
VIRLLGIHGNENIIGARHSRQHQKTKQKNQPHRYQEFTLSGYVTNYSDESLLYQRVKGLFLLLII